MNGYTAVDATEGIAGDGKEVTIGKDGKPNDGKVGLYSDIAGGGGRNDVV